MSEPPCLDASELLLKVHLIEQTCPRDLGASGCLTLGEGAARAAPVLSALRMSCTFDQVGPFRNRVLPVKLPGCLLYGAALRNVVRWMFLVVAQRSGGECRELSVLDGRYDAAPLIGL